MLEDVLGDGVNVEPLIDHRVGEQMQAGVEEAEVAQRLADADGPVDLEEDLRGRAGERQHQQHESVEAEAVLDFGDGIGAQVVPQRPLAKPSQRKQASKKESRDNTWQAIF